MSSSAYFKEETTKEKLLSYLPEYWKTAIPTIVEQSYWDDILKSINDAIKEKGLVIPGLNTIFKAFETFDPENFKLLLIGQDPYPTIGDANGYAFWSNARTPAKSYERMLDELGDEFGSETIKKMRSGDLSHWRDQGVFMMNSALTLPKVPGRRDVNHRNVWKPFTKDIIDYLDNHFTFATLAMGKVSYEFADMIIENKGLVVKTGHPSPLNTRIPFIGTGCFRRCNELLMKNEILPVRWTI